jgi:hypothetical protein
MRSSVDGCKFRETGPSYKRFIGPWNSESGEGKVNKNGMMYQKGGYVRRGKETVRNND